jgi:C-terminal processing protease CtpA/Prc
MATTSTVDYYHVLEELCAKLRDGHTNVYLPRGIATQGIPINTQLIDGHVIVTNVYTNELADDGIRVGQEVLELDGKPVLKRAAEDAIPYVSASTDLAREHAAYDFYLTRGTSKSLRVKLQDRSGAVSEHTINRGGYKWDLVPKRERVESKVLRSNIGYIAVNDCGSGQEGRIDEAMPKVMNTAALIVDLRRNGGGSSGVGYHLLGYLTDRPIAGSRQVVRHYIPTFRARGMEMELVEMPADEIQPHRKALYSKPVVVLTTVGTASAAEDFCVSFKTIGRGKFIGEATNGSTGQPLMLSLPGGGAARVCTKHDTFPDGSEFVGAECRQIFRYTSRFPISGPVWIPCSEPLSIIWKARSAFGSTS